MILLIVGFGIFILVLIAPAPQSLLDLITQKAPSGYKLDRGTETIWETVNRKLRPEAFKAYQAQPRKRARLSTRKRPTPQGKKGGTKQPNPY